MDSPSESAPPNEPVAPSSRGNAGERYEVLRNWLSLSRAVGKSIRQSSLHSLSEHNDAFRENLENLSREYRDAISKLNALDDPNRGQPNGDQPNGNQPNGEFPDGDQ